MQNKEISRRNFLKGAAGCTLALGVGLGVGFSLHGARKYFMPTLDEKMREGMIELSLNKNIAPIDYGKKAILVQAEKERKDDIYIMNQLFGLYGYNCMTIKPEEASEDNIVSKIEKLAKESQEDQQTIFYFSGHGTYFERFGSALRVKGRNYHNGRITESELFGALGRVKGKKATLLDCCHSGAFTDFLKNMETQDSSKHIIDNYIAIAACPSGKNSLSTNLLIKDKYIGNLTYILYNSLNPGKKIDLSTIDIEFKEKRFLDNLKEFDQSINPDGEHELSFDIQRAYDTSFVL